MSPTRLSRVTTVSGWYPEQRMTRDEALAAMTRWPAYAAFEERVMGSLRPGQYADFVLLDRDIMTIPADEILTAHVVATYVGGVPVYDAQHPGHRGRPADQ